MKLTEFKKKSQTEPAEMYSSPEKREETVGILLEDAKCAKSGTEQYFQKMRSYYDGTHMAESTTGQFLSDAGLPWKPATVPDGYMHVESQIVAEVPDFEFSGREESDAEKAKLREQVVKYVCDNADLTRKNASNERRLNLYGTAVWKLSVGMGDNGEEIVVDNPSPEMIYPDPAAVTVDDCEYIGYVYSMSRIKAERVFEYELSKAGTTVSEITAQGGRESDIADSVEIVEWWYRQPKDGEAECEYIVDGKTVKDVCRYKAGDIAFSLFICGREIKNVPKFWDKTDCKKFPFVIYNKTPRDGSIWGKSELEAIIPLIDAADRQLAFAQLNTAFAANDVVVYEENSFAADSYPENAPGAVWKLRPGMIDKVKRLGGLASDNIAHYDIVEKYRTLMKDALGNYDYLQGSATSQVTTATGLALLSDRANKRMNAKQVCKKAGFERLYRLIDYMALEIFDDDMLRMIIGDGTVSYGYGKDGYLPQIDVTVNVGDGVDNSRSFTLSALSELMAMNITDENYPMVRAYISMLAIPERAEICEALDKKFKYEIGESQ
ncbi:MAG: hypothetical protein J5832_02645 [Clostridia bacterium]|nr:hypothetical protein [Clostridia bacterium]